MPCMLEKKQDGTTLFHRYVDMYANVLKMIQTKRKTVETSGEGAGSGVTAEGDLASLCGFKVSILFLNF